MAATFSTDVELVNQIDGVAKLLDDIVRGKIISPIVRRDDDPILRFIIARKWNSWYPSYFDTKGGCYAFITRDSNDSIKENKGVIVIDPGIKFWDILRKIYNIEPHNVRSIIVSHYHPDHSMGLFELLTVTNETEYSCTYYLNRTSFEAFKPFQGKYNKIVELAGSERIRLAKYKPSKIYDRFSIFDDYVLPKSISEEQLFMDTLKTFHNEIGNRNNSLGLKFTIKSDGSEQELIILGDTDGNETYLNRYIDFIKDARILVLHLGSFTDNGFGIGNKHLYKRGLLNILNCINCIKDGYIKKEGKIQDCIDKKILNYQPCRKLNNERVVRVKPGINIDMCELRREIKFKNLKLVLISELGLEMAPTSELIDSFGDFKWFKDFYPFFLFLKLKDADYGDIYCDIFSTKAFLSMQSLMNISIMPMDTIIKAYIFMIYLGIYFSYELVFKREKKSGSGSHRSANPKYRYVQIEKLVNNIEKAYLKSSESIDSELFAEDFLAMIKKDISETYLREYEENAVGIFSKFINTVYFNYFSAAESPTKALNEVVKGIKSIFKNLINLPDAISKHVKDDIKMGEVYENSWKKNITDIEVFIKSIGVMDTEVLSQFSNKIKKGDLRVFDSLFYFTCIEILKALERIDLASIYKMDKDFRCRGLSEILENYNDNDSDIKFFVANCGIELDLSDDLRIKSYDGGWISVKKAQQSFRNGAFLFETME
jgi:hypothetical protein